VNWVASDERETNLASNYLLTIRLFLRY